MIPLQLTQTSATSSARRVRRPPNRIRQPGRSCVSTHSLLINSLVGPMAAEDSGLVNKEALSVTYVHEMARIVSLSRAPGIKLDLLAIAY